MATATIEELRAQMEAAQARHDAWFQRMEKLHEEIATERREAARERRKTERLFQESRERADRERAETERLSQESRERADHERAETERLSQESRKERDRDHRETERSLRELRKELGALGEKFGGFAEGMALPSMERRLHERFGTTAFAARVRSRRGAEEMELDALAHAGDGAGLAVVVEVKSHLRNDGIDQVLRTLAAFPRFYPEHRGKKLIGVLATVDAPPELRARVLREGLILATIQDDLFDFQVPADFEPRAFPNPAATN